MDAIEEFERVLLKDGQIGSVMEVLGDQDKFIVDIGSSPADWETIYVSREDIVRVFK